VLLNHVHGTYDSICESICPFTNRRNQGAISIKKGPVFHRMKNFEPSCGICPLTQNFYVFCGIRYWMLIRGQMWNIFSLGSGGRHLNFYVELLHINECAVKYMTATRTLSAGMINSTEILPVYLADCIYRISQRQILHIWSGSKDHRKLIAIYIEICHSERQNLAK